jgi:peptidoglycan/xylan/chitin deacetylase (PgdA/CDA1 family)
MVPDAKWRPTAPILLYHRFDAMGSTNLWTVTTSVFESQLQRLKAGSRPVARLRSVIDEMRGAGPPLAAGSVAITADDGDRSVYTDMFPLLRRYEAPATLFVNPFSISRSPGAVTWEQLEEMHRSGLIDVQFHTLSHADLEFERKRRSRTDYECLVDFELHYSRDWIESRLHSVVDMLAWPYGYYDRELEQMAARAGYAAAFAMTKRAPEDDSIYSIPRVAIFNRHRAGERFRTLLEQADSFAPPDAAVQDAHDNRTLLEILQHKKRSPVRFID